MANFKIDRFKYTWKANWSSGTEYNRDDVVYYNGTTYVCIRQHTASSLLEQDQIFVPAGTQDVKPAWVVMTESNTFVGEWAATNQYYKGNIVSYGGNLYLCTATHLSTTTLEGNLSDWTIYLDIIKFQNEWQPVTEYRVGDVVRYNGIVYECIETHNSNNENSGLEIDQSKWQIYYEGISFQGQFQSGTRYKVNDLVEDNGTLFRCVVGYISQDGISDNNWQIEFFGNKYLNEWQSTVYYSVGNIVRVGGVLFYSIKNNYNKPPINSIYDIPFTEDGSTLDINWLKLSDSINFRGIWDVNQEYKTGDIVRRGGNLYIAKLDTSVSGDGSSLEYLDDSNWELINLGYNFTGSFDNTKTYQIADVVSFRGSLYKAKIAHDSTVDSYPDSTAGATYWDAVIVTITEIGTSMVGDLFTRGIIVDQLGGAGVVLGIDGQPTGAPAVPEELLERGITAVRIGSTDRIVQVGDKNDIIYRNWGSTNRVVYVAPTGLDSISNPNRGYSPLFPWKTIRFACEKTNDNFVGTTTIEVATGRYEEILPIIVPARTVVRGSELRSTTVIARGPIENLSLDSTYTIAVLERIKDIIFDLILGNVIEKTPGNEVNQSFTILGSLNTAAYLENLIDNIIHYIDFYIDSGDVNPVLSGSNQITLNSEFIVTERNLEINKEFLIKEAIAFMNLNFSSYNYDENFYEKNIRSFIEGLQYDLLYFGNYKSLLAARYYRNAVLGSTGEDMFYLRDTTGLRDMTITGLTGILNPPGVFELFRLPTGGAFCSLDPGWGPNDEAVWIVNRSPYIQGVTTIGDNCTGQKIDGSLHAGGNKSMVSNDFTQVISDGIGAWILNNGRAELVSVFTYYCNVGYLATGGGIIRATNGNNSYGNFGAIANGIDITEQPKTAVVNNRTQQAIVSGILSDGATEGIQIFEWLNAGQFYTEANATVIGAGSGAQTKFEDFRDDAIFEARLLDTSTTVIENIGGGGYTISQNNVQEHQTPGGDATSITIASNDANQEADYLGMRLIIINGTGAGQYGYITGYNTVTKVVTVSRESNNQPGWDHVVPGTPIAVPLDNTATYRIEPRVTFEDPGFDATNITISASSNWSRIIYGETTEQYSNVSSSAGTGDTIDIEPAPARFNVVKNGRTYTVSLENGGAGYNIGDEIILSGSGLGGTTPENDITITVVQTTDDSTNAVIDFTFQGTGISGRYVITTKDGVASSYSRTGIDWDNTTLPSEGNWDCLAAGINRFVAIRSNSNQAAYSLDGITWSATTMPEIRNWKSVIFGDGKFLAIASDQNSAALSNDGITWTSTSMPVFGDSTDNEWVDVTYGKNLFVAVANSQNISAYSTDGISWQGALMDVIADSTQKDWVSVAYGNNRFVTISSQGDIAYSFNGIDWRSGGTMPSQDGSTAHNWKRIRYAQGVFFAIGDTGSRNVSGDITTGPTTFAATSYDGIVWTNRELASSLAWEDIAFGNPYVQQEDSTVGKNSPRWIAVAANTDTVNLIRTGAKALGRVKVSTGIINELSIWDPGSGYRSVNPAVTIVSPTRTADALIECRLADGVLANPSWINRGFGYRTLTTDVIISGNGFADIIPNGNSVVIEDLERLPGPGFQILFSGNSRIYTVITVTELENNGNNNKFTARLRVDPVLRARDKLEHGTTAILRERISQCRITGHDFLDIGTGNFEQTNYPELYITGNFVPRPENEVVEQNGGRVFYTSTDQLGNFRGGELFAVEQATGIVTISADFFDLRGLTELALGGIRVGGSGVVIREFSTDPLFIADSNNIVPTQRAIAAFLNNRLTVGGSQIAVPSFIAGQVLVGPDQIASSSGAPLIFRRMAIFDGSDGVAGNIAGSIMAQTIFYRSFSDKIL